MAKGAESKSVIFNKLQEVFPGAFWEDQGKILRIPLTEDGARVEIKVSLTAAKTNLGGNEPESAFEASSFSFENSVNTRAKEDKESTSVSLEPTQEEKENVSRLIAALGL